MTHTPQILANTRGSRRYALRIVGAQVLHAGFIFAFPTAATLVAGVQIWQGEVRSWMPLLAIVLYALTMLGITVGYHRLLAHRAFQASPRVAAILIVLGCMAAQGAPIYWVSNHRRHHLYSDEDGDPHSPHVAGKRRLSSWRGFLHAHIGWMFTHELTSSIEFSRDLLQNTQVRAINRHYWLWVAVGIALPVSIGWVIEGSMKGMIDGLIWGAGVRLFLSYHLTSSINSITHLFGYRSFHTVERSKNNFWLGIPTLGEAWHNNHHAFPTSAIFGMKWWEVDLGGLTIMLLEACGLARDVRRPTVPRSAAPLPDQSLP